MSVTISQVYYKSSLLIHPDLDWVRHKLFTIPISTLQSMLSSLLQDPALTLETIQPLLPAWTQWLEYLRALKINSGHDHANVPDNVTKTQLILIFLGKEVENAVDVAWHTSPFTGLLYDATAKALLMRTVKELLPQVESCAPVPLFSNVQQELLQKEGLLQQTNATLTHRYAVLTYMPYIGGCEVCTIQQSCKIRP